jgi:hypothetical protein
VREKRIESVELENATLRKKLQEPKYEQLSYESLKEILVKKTAELQIIEKAVFKAAEEKIIQNECIVCMDAKCQVLCTPCGHYVKMNLGK